MKLRMVMVAATLMIAGLRIISAILVQRSQKKFPPAGAFVKVNGTRLHYLRGGSGKPVVFLHGGGLTMHDFMHSIFDRVAQKYQAVLFDRPGYGYSRRPFGKRLNAALNVRLIHKALKKLGIRKPVLVGHSSGGSVALRYALEHPKEVKGLVLIAPSAYAEGTSIPPLYLGTEIPILSSLILQTIFTLLLGAIGKLFVRGMFTPDPPPADYAGRIVPFLFRPSHFRTWAKELMNLRRDLEEQSPHYEKIGISVAIIAGEDDPQDPPDQQAARLHRVIPRSRLVLLPGIGHMVHHRHPGVVLRALRKVL